MASEDGDSRVLSHEPCHKVWGSLEPGSSDSEDEGFLAGGAAAKMVAELVWSGALKVYSRSSSESSVASKEDLAEEASTSCGRSVESAAVARAQEGEDVDAKATEDKDGRGESNDEEAAAEDEDDEEKLQVEDVLTDPALANETSSANWALHLAGKCTPCHFQRGARICNNGVLCNFCHLHPSRPFRKHPGKRSRLRIARRMAREAAEQLAGVDGEGPEEGPDVGQGGGAQPPSAAAAKPPKQVPSAGPRSGQDCPGAAKVEPLVQSLAVKDHFSLLDKAFQKRGLSAAAKEAAVAAKSPWWQPARPHGTLGGLDLAAEAMMVML